MPERGLYPLDQSSEHEQNALLIRAVELEKELMKAKRIEKVLREVEQRYLSLVDSSVFLHMLLSPSGTLRLMNRRAEEFFGFQLNIGTEITLHSLVGPRYKDDLNALLQEAQEKSVHVTLPAPCADGSPGWLDMELSETSYQGDSAIRVIAVDVTGLVKGKTSSVSSQDSKEDTATALSVLNSCPGLLCFAVDKKGTLIYSTRGYREVAKRFMGHECQSGVTYPSSLSSSFDMELYELLQEAFIGQTNMSSLVEQREDGDNHWNMTTAPLLSAEGEVVGAVVHLTPQAKRSNSPDSAKSVIAPESPSLLVTASITPPSPEAASYSLSTQPGLCVLLNEEGQCTAASRAFLSLLKVKESEILGHQLTELSSESDSINEELAQKINKIIREKSLEEIEIKLCIKDAEIFYLTLKGSPSATPAEHSGMMFSCVDNTRLKRMEEQLKRVSTTDTSTGILNRQGLERILYTEVERAARYRGSLSVIMLDIDSFRGLNERLGYAASDRVLKDLAALLKARIRSTDFLGRWGGDEFMVLTPSPVGTAFQLAEQLRDMAHHNSYGNNITLTLSAGVSELKKGMDVSAFIASAYDAMTEAKRYGGNRSIQAKQHEAAERVEASE